MKDIIYSFFLKKKEKLKYGLMFLFMIVAH